MTLFKRLSIALLILGLNTASADDRPPAITTARTIGLGGSATALSDDAGTSFWNPSGVPLLQRTELAFSYADRYGMGIKSNYGSFVYPLFERHALGIDFLRESFGDGELSDAFQILNATYGVRPFQFLSLGLSGKWVSQNIDLNGASLRSAGGFGFDLGLLLTPRFKPLDRLRLGITLKDVGGTSVRDENSQVKEEVFKQTWRVGTSYRLRDDLMVALDVDDKLYAGAEYQPHAMLALRGGLNRDLSAPAGADNTLTYALGFGLRWKNARIDYAFEHHPVLPATHHLSMALAYNPAIVGIQDALVRPSPVFKSLYKTYEATEFVDVVLKNSSQESLPVTVSIDIPTLTQTPHEQTITLKPNSTERYGFTLTFPQDLLFTQSSKYDNLVQPSVTVSYMQGRSSKTATKRLNSVYVLGKGKLSWSNAHRIAAFVTPQSQTVEGFARGVMAPYADMLQQRFPKNNIGKAALVFDALSAYGLRYQQDQTTPYLQIFEDDSVFDTVQYPYEFLQSKVGDCDDCTVVYASMLENLNIPTAALDVNDPEYGHIYMMFDSGIPSTKPATFSPATRNTSSGKAGSGFPWKPRCSASPLPMPGAMVPMNTTCARRGVISTKSSFPKPSRPSRPAWCPMPTSHCLHNSKSTSCSTATWPFSTPAWIRSPWDPACRWTAPKGFTMPVRPICASTSSTGRSTCSTAPLTWMPAWPTPTTPKASF